MNIGIAENNEELMTDQPVMTRSRFFNSQTGLSKTYEGIDKLIAEGGGKFL